MTHSSEGTTRSSSEGTTRSADVVAKRTSRRIASPRTIAVACAVGLAVTLAACSGSSTSATTTSKPAAAQTASKSGNQTVVTVTNSATWGPILTLSNKDTLYRLTADSTNKSVCSGACLVAWPAVVLASGQTNPVGRGVTGLGTIRRSDGKLQVTYQGIPLYLFVGDHAPGQVNGNIKDTWGQWWVVNPAHPTATPQPIMTPNNAAASTGSTAATTPATTATTPATSPATTPTTSAPTPTTQAPTPTTKPTAPSSGGGGVSY
jgi:predicted lipoprotein with Yx(FWY)xxD motif